MGTDLADREHEADSGVAAGLAAAGFVQAQEVGRGGFGVVYRCKQARLDRVVAVKVLAAGLGEDRARFVREQQAMGRLTGHPNIVAVLQVGELSGGSPYLVMPVCEHGSVQGRIARLGRLSLDEVLRVGVKIAGALVCTHRLGIVHRDVKPANILLTEYGEPALCDFGFARIQGAFTTATGMIAGSPAFLAPEVICGEAPSVASDVYGLGASLFAALTGHAAFERRVGEKVVAQFVRITREAVPDLREDGVPDDVAEVINAAMARDPGQRPSPLQLGEQLQRVQVGHGLPVDEMALHDSDGSQRRARRSATAPPAAPTAVSRGNLPTAVGGFVGRSSDLTRVRELLGSARLVSLTGIGGIGKTTLATHAARQCSADFPDGVWLVELAELREASLLPGTMATTLGLRDQPGRSPVEVLVDYLASRRVLLVLDNCEHLIAEAANLAQTLLHGCPHLRILATSREILDVDGEAVVALAPLTVPDPTDRAALSALAGYEAVTLFVERAGAALPGFRLSEANRDAVARICARADGLPLALELAAARVRALPVEQIAAGLSDRFALLTRGRRGAPTRQHTLAGCIQWSYQLCTATEQQLWAHLSVFAGSFDLPAAQHLCAGVVDATDCLDMLCALVDKSIVNRAEPAAGEGRFKLLETLRDYGTAQLDAGQSHQLRQRHAGWYRHLFSQAWDEWFGPRQTDWLHRLNAEIPNIREALQFSLTTDPAAALHIATDVRPFWLLRGMLSEGHRWLDQALRATPHEPTPLRIRGLSNAAVVGALQRDLKAARARVAEGRALLENVDNPQLHALVDHADGYLALYSGEFQRARECHQRAVDATDDYETRTASTLFIGFILHLLGAHDEAMEWNRKGLAAAESRGDPYRRAAAQIPLAISLWRQHEVPEAEHLLLNAFESLSLLGDSQMSPVVLEALAWISGSRHDHRRAVVLMAAASALTHAAELALLPFPEIARWHKNCVRGARSELGPDEFDAAWAEGAALSLPGAAAYALASVDSTRSVAASASAGLVPDPSA